MLRPLLRASADGSKPSPNSRANLPFFRTCSDAFSDMRHEIADGAVHCRSDSVDIVLATLAFRYQVDKPDVFILIQVHH